MPRRCPAVLPLSETVRTPFHQTPIRPRWRMSSLEWADHSPVSAAELSDLSFAQGRARRFQWFSLRNRSVKTSVPVCASTGLSRVRGSEGFWHWYSLWLNILDLQLAAWNAMSGRLGTVCIFWDSGQIKWASLHTNLILSHSISVSPVKSPEERSIYQKPSLLIQNTASCVVDWPGDDLLPFKTKWRVNKTLKQKVIKTILTLLQSDWATETFIIHNLKLSLSHFNHIHTCNMTVT